MSKKILILGANGFIGRNLTEWFTQDSKLEIHAPSKEELNALNSAQVKQYLETHAFDILLNALDRKLHEEQDNCWSRYLEERLRMFINLYHCRDLYGKMLYYGTGAEYARELPVVSIKETEFGRKIPSDTYGMAMNIMSRISEDADNIYNFRLFGIFGKYEDLHKRFISYAICRALDGHPILMRQNAVFDYLYIDDLTAMTQYFVHHDMKYHQYNAASGKKYELLHLADLAIKATGIQVPIQIEQPGYNKEYTADASRILEETGVILHTIEDSIGLLTQYYYNLKEKSNAKHQ